LLLPFHFDESAGDMGMPRLEISGLVKGGDCFGKLSRCQARVSVRKGMQR
jgi:hypothetical protein